MNRYAYGALKRSIDIAGSTVGIVLLAIPGLAIASAIRLTMGRPVLFRQLRPGLLEAPFVLWKFRTMREAGNSAGEPLPDSERLTPLGRLLRATSLDELPALWNVLRGEMSLVGPRPLLMEYLPLYDGDQRRRHAVKPGMTGWAQVRGRNAISWGDRFAMDVWYVSHASVWLDLKILALTVLTVASRRGVNARGHATMPKFQGNLTEDRRG